MIYLIHPHPLPRRERAFKNCCFDNSLHANKSRFQAPSPYEGEGWGEGVLT